MLLEQCCPVHMQSQIAKEQVLKEQVLKEHVALCYTFQTLRNM